MVWGFVVDVGQFSLARDVCNDIQGPDDTNVTDCQNGGYFPNMDDSINLPTFSSYGYSSASHAKDIMNCSNIQNAKLTRKYTDTEEQWFLDRGLTAEEYDMEIEINLLNPICSNIWESVGYWEQNG